VSLGVFCAPLQQQLTEGHEVTPPLDPAQTFTQVIEVQELQMQMTYQNIVKFTDVQCSNGVIHALIKLTIRIIRYKNLNLIKKAPDCGAFFYLFLLACLFHYLLQFSLHLHFFSANILLKLKSTLL
jgi:hypothetical protein